MPITIAIYIAEMPSDRAPQWENLAGAGVQRLAIPGGMLYRPSWNMQATSQPAMTFVPDMTMPDDPRLDQILAMVTTLAANQKQENAAMAVLDDDIKALTDATAAQTTVVNSAVTAMNGQAQVFADAVAAAIAQGATPAQLQPITDAINASVSNTAALAAAIATLPGQPAPAPPTVPVVTPSA